MRFIVMVKGDKDYEAGAPPNPQLMAAIGQNAEELIKAGVMVSTEGLQPSSRGAKVSPGGGHPRAVVVGRMKRDDASSGMSSPAGPSSARVSLKSSPRSRPTGPASKETRTCDA